MPEPLASSAVLLGYALAAVLFWQLAAFLRLELAGPDRDTVLFLARMAGLLTLTAVALALLARLAL